MMLSSYLNDKPTEPFDIAVGGNALWISFRVHTSQATNYSVSKFDIDAGTIEYDIELGNSFPSQVAWHDNQLWILDSTNNLALIYNDMTGIIISTYQTGLNPSGIAFSETHAWITNKGDFFITTVPLLGSKSIKNINVNCWTFPDCTLDGIVIKNNQAIIYSTTYQKVYRIDLQTYQTVNEYDIRVPKDITVLKDQIFVLNGNRSRNDIGRTMTIIKP